MEMNPYTQKFIESTGGALVDVFATMSMSTATNALGNGHLQRRSDYHSFPTYGTSVIIRGRVVYAIEQVANKHAPSSSVAKQILEVSTALSLNKSQLAEVLGITRPTLYEWQAGKQPHDSNTGRLEKLLRLMTKAGVTVVQPLNARFVRKAVAPAKTSLLALLTAETFDDRKIMRALVDALNLSREDQTQRAERTVELRRLGYEEPSEVERRERLASNVAQMEWPK
jgi:DNA-binding transcriptional regulator YiaG